MKTTTADKMLNDLMTATLNRRRMLMNAGIATAALAAPITFGKVSAQMDSTPTDMTGMTATPEAAPFASAVEVLNYALTLEHLETAFYRDGLATIGAEAIAALGFADEVFANLTVIGEHEAEHVAVLTQVITDLGGEPVAEAVYDFGYTDAAGFLATAQALEDTGVSAYQGAAQYAMESDELLTAALTIHGVEARHASYVALLNGAVPFPASFNPTLTPAEVLDIATPFFVN
jgi:rubrerythrin